MQKPGKMFLFSKVLLIGLALWSWGCAPRPELVPSPQPTASSVPTAFMPPQKSWIMVNLPSDATQLQYGGEVYRLACSACHAYDGQGLTAAWRATWAPADQNCWQSKCHGPNHPPDGFELPVAPPVKGAEAMSSFATARELHDYIQSYMPWENPGTLTGKESWAVTAYILKMNQINPGAELSASTASQIQLR